MNIDEKAFFIVIGGVIVTILNHFYIKRREKQNEILDSEMTIHGVSKKM